MTSRLLSGAVLAAKGQVPQSQVLFTECSRLEVIHQTRNDLMHDKDSLCFFFSTAEYAYWGMGKWTSDWGCSIAGRRFNLYSSAAFNPLPTAATCFMWGKHVGSRTGSGGGVGRQQLIHASKPRLKCKTVPFLRQRYS